MTEHDVDRREFHKLTLAAFSGIVAGAAAGCGETPKPAPPPATALGTPAAAPAGLALTDKQVELLTDDIHVCRGLNTCKGKGRSQENDCAGQGTCASVADHSCGADGECATLGGCGETAGLNECKGKGGCHVPLMAGAWDKAREAYEAAMKKKDLKFGDAPKPEKKSVE